jgi:uncharacterized protein (TIGR00299 family) protein
MSRIAYVEMVGGAAGDMLLGALVDAGAERGEIERALRTIAPDGWTLHFERTVRGGISSLRCRLEVPGEDPALGEHVHDHGDGVSHTHGAAVMRSLADVCALLDASGLTPAQKQRARAIYERLAAAEATVHGTTAAAIHFHEVGALDAVLDVAGVCVALDLLGIDEIFCSPFPIGRGRVRMVHGLYPNPPPASAVMLAGAPLEALDIAAELVTPTAVAILTTLVARPGARPSQTLERVGYGAGRSDFSIPNVVRVLVGTTAETRLPNLERPPAAEGGEPATISVLEANIDDMSPQHYALAVERIFAAGARDVWLTPIVMKKQRPAVVLSAIARREDEAAVAAAMLRETTTIGVRTRTERKYVLPRRIEAIETPLGRVRIKISGTGEEQRALPEHDDIVSIARITGRPLLEVVRIVQACADRALETITS